MGQVGRVSTKAANRVDGASISRSTLPDGTLTETRTYDNNGNLLTVTHFSGFTTTYTYDTENRLLSRATPGEMTVSFTYTATGKYATSTDASGTTTYTYDAMDRLITKATPEGTLNYTFDAAGHVASIASSNANGASVSYTYDDLDRLSTVVDNRLTGSNTTTYTYDPASNVATVTYPNGVQSTFAYDALNRVTGLSSATANYSYQRGATGDLTSVTESSGRGVTWNYDGINRLTSETIASAPSGKNGAVTYNLDPVGNRLSDTSTLSGISAASATYNPDDEASSETYDQNGNVTSTGGKTFVYDAENHLISMNGGAVTLVYDAFGNRVAKTVGGVTTKYLVEDDVNPTGYPQVFEELSGAGTVERVYTYGLQRISENQPISGSWTPSFYGYDGGGSVRQLTNAAGAVTDTNEYDAFGNLVNLTGTTPNRFLYRGEEYDSDLGLYYLRARYYNPVIGRFLERDPENGDLADPAALHKYLYANGNPINMMDPTGRYGESGVLKSPVGGAIGEYAGIIAFISFQAVPAVRSFESELLCILASDTTRFSAEITVNLLYGGAGDVVEDGKCGWTPTHDCTPYEQAMQQWTAEVQRRYQQMKTDWCSLYPWRGIGDGHNPKYPRAGTWYGHDWWYVNVAQSTLKQAIKAAIDHDCPVPPDAIYWANVPAPSCPD